MISFKQIKATVSIETVLRHYAIFDHLVKKGESYRGTCPFCTAQENLPFSASLAKNCFNAFCCGEHGNILDLVAKLEDVTVKQAANIISEFTSIVVEKEPSNPQRESQKPEPKTTKSQISKANIPLEFTLKGIDPAHTCVTTLGLSEELVARFGAGFYTGRGMFKDHFVMPVYSHDHELVAYTGITLENPTKAVYPPTFNQELALFGQDRVCNEISADKPLIVCVDPLQVLILAQAGYESVAIMTNQVSDEQVKSLSQYSGVRSVITLLVSENNNYAVDILSRLITLFHLRLVRYPTDLNKPTGFNVEDVNDLLVL